MMDNKSILELKTSKKSFLFLERILVCSWSALSVVTVKSYSYVTVLFAVFVDKTELN